VTCKQLQAVAGKNPGQKQAARGNYTEQHIAHLLEIMYLNRRFHLRRHADFFRSANRASYKPLMMSSFSVFSNSGSTCSWLLFDFSCTARATMSCRIVRRWIRQRSRKEKLEVASTMARLSAVVKCVQCKNMRLTECKQQRCYGGQGEQSEHTVLPSLYYDEHTAPV
jgi:hypothetical protein